jgi:hypothetical protein
MLHTSRLNIVNKRSSMCAMMMTHDDGGDTQVMRRHHTQVTVVTKKQPLVTTAFLHTKSNSCITPPHMAYATAMSCSHGHASRRLHPPHQHDAHPRPRVCARTNTLTALARHNSPRSVRLRHRVKRSECSSSYVLKRGQLLGKSALQSAQKGV